MIDNIMYKMPETKEELKNRIETLEAVVIQYRSLYMAVNKYIYATETPVVGKAERELMRLMNRLDSSYVSQM